jgi:hypothetical protein
MKKKGELWYKSPFREETEASFKLNPQQIAWYDFGVLNPMPPVSK